MTELVLVEEPAPHVRQLTLNRPEELNAMTSELSEALRVALRRIAAERSARAEEALRIGLVADVLDEEKLLERALEAATQIASLAPWGVRLTKQGMWAALEIPSQQAAVEYEDRPQIMATFGRALPEAVGAFLEKRPAEFAD